MVPNGVSIGRPPALAAPEVEVWQTAQLPSAASCAPRAIVAAENTDASGRAIGAIVRHGRIAAPMPIAAAQRAAIVANAPRRFTNGFQRPGEGGAVVTGAGRASAVAAVLPWSPARIRSGVNGGSRKRTPVASKIAFAIAAAPGTEADSPTPSGGWSCRGSINTSILGMSGKVMMG